MKILQVTNFFKPSFEAGGVTRVAYAISKYLCLMGHEVTVFTTNRSLNETYVETNKPLNMENMTVYYYENLRKYFIVKIPPIPYQLLFVAKKKVRDFDIIHIHEHRSLLAVIIHYYAKKYRIPYLVQPHGSVLPSFEKQYFKRIFDFFFGNRILMDASRIIALNSVEVEQVKSLGIDESKIEIIPNGIDISEYGALPKKGEFKEKYSISTNEKIVLYLGRINKIKGIDLLIEAFSNLKENHSDVKLVIVGPDDGFLSTLKIQTNDLNLNDCVLFIGPLYDLNKLEAYVDADVYVLPSRYETFPNTVLEACLCGTPVIITDRCGISDLVVNNKFGYVVKFDKDQLKCAIAKSLTEKVNNDVFLDHAQNLKNNFNWSVVIMKIECLYKSICKETQCQTFSSHNI